MYYSGSAYCERNTILNWTCGEACTSQPDTTEVVNIVDDSKGTFGYVAYNSNQDQIIVAFRGSQNIQNWFTNLNLEKVDYKNVKNA